MYEDKELKEYRDLLETPDHFEEGFDWKTVIGAIFIGFLMMPGSMYLQLVIGTGIGPAARWVTIILFAELAKRSYSELKQQEIFLLYYISWQQNMYMLFVFCAASYVDIILDYEHSLASFILTIILQETIIFYHFLFS